ncbi:hypothetical protein ONE63_003701 [Megalurothrips usitatus]|uniref:Homeotic protein Sex combs reduced-like n=1 Tax=Megalurothrips usitatus TaxID=439358 RepID=A0AAV7X9U0_9NEOP|nr:hypothetical protein ONE63_003701 [Megalurothrips usitatus]
MSSYQFVNSLASCYANQSQQQAQARTGPSPVEGHHQQHSSTATSPGGDYYNSNGNYSASPTCYSPQGYGQQGYGHMAGAGDMMDYTQLHPATSHQRHLQQHMPTSPGPGPAPPAPSGLLSPNASCKYEGMSMTPSVSSPQDLSSSSSSSVAAKSSSAGAKASSSVTSPVTVSTRPSASASPGLNEASPSPASSTSSTSSGNNNHGSSKSGGGSSGPSGNPPQIYPWMKRVHLGQSEYRP